MASPTALEVDMLHASSLDFALDDISALSSTQLALVLFHPYSTPAHVDCARIEFMRRREVFLAAEVERIQRGSEQPAAVAAPRVCAPISPSLEPRDASLSAPAASPPATATKVKREVQEISLLDSDDDVVVLHAPRPAKQKQKQARQKSAASPAQSSKRTASALTVPEVAAETSPKRRKTMPVAAAAKSASPPRQETVSLRDQLKRLSSKPRPAAPSPSVPPPKPVLPVATSAPTTPPPPPVGPRAAPHAPSRVAFASPAAQTTIQPRVPSRAAAAAVPEVSVDPRKRPGPAAAAAAPLQAASAPAARPPVASAPPSRAPAKEPSLDFLYRPSQAPAPDAIPAAVLPLPVFAANPITAPAHSALPPFAFTAHGPPPKHEPDHEFWFRPPRPFPTFSPLPTDFPHAADDVIPVELASQLHTVRVHGLSKAVTQRLLLAFSTRNQHRLRPRVLAFRTRPMSGMAAFYLAFRSEQDALLTIEGSNGRLLPHFHDPRMLEMELVRNIKEPSAAAETPVKQAPSSAVHEAAGKAKVGLERELALEWTWGEMSDEVRQEWLASKSLPRYRVCPQYEFEADVDNGILINDEYDDEVTHILKLENRKERDRRKARRPLSSGESSSSTKSAARPGSLGSTVPSPSERRRCRTARLTGPHGQTTRRSRLTSFSVS